MSAIDTAYSCERCGCTTPEEVTGGWRCSRCEYQPAECTCYEMTSGHMPGCPFNGAKKGASDG